MQTVSFGELEEAALTLTFGVTGPSPLKTFMPDQVRLKYSRESPGDTPWVLEYVEIFGWAVEPLGGRCAVGSTFRDASLKLPQWAVRFASGVDPAQELARS